VGTRAASKPSRPDRRRIVRGLTAAVVLVLAVSFVTDAGSSRGWIQGLLYWSLVAAPMALGIVFFARFLDRVGGFLGGGSPYDGHGPEDRHRR
jgi:hypothetical protein